MVFHTLGNAISLVLYDEVCWVLRGVFVYIIIIACSSWWLRTTIQQVKYIYKHLVAVAIHWASYLLIHAWPIFACGVFAFGVFGERIEFEYMFERVARGVFVVSFVVYAAKNRSLFKYRYFYL